MRRVSSILFLIFMIASLIVAGTYIAGLHRHHNAAVKPAEPTYRASTSGMLPDPILTPGAVREGATKEQICSTNTKEFRNVSNSLKEQVRRRYGMHGKRDLWCNSNEGCEIDHLIPLELGSSNDITNLWPQPYEGENNAHQKDILEGKLHKMVCGGQISLEDAQTAIRTNWIDAYKKYVGQDD